MIIDICTVNYNDNAHLNLNIKNYKSILPYDFNWLIGDNSNSLVDFDYKNVRVFSGLDYEVFDHPALHHTHTLNTLFKNTSSDLVIITDPDFYVYDFNILFEIIEDIISNDIFLYGVPWHPKWSRKYKDFPAVHFMIINKKSSTYNESFIDFRPSRLTFSINPKINLRKSITSLHKIYYLFKRSLVIYNDGDTGSRIYNYRKSIKYKVLTVLVQPKENYLSFPNEIILFFDLFFSRKFIPINYSYIIKSILDKDCEFFLLNKKIFGFHFRGNVRLKRDKYSEVKQARNLLSRVINV